MKENAKNYKKTTKSLITMQCDDRAVANKGTLESGSFKKACENAEVPVTLRQASKWNNGKGKAFKVWNKIAM